LARVMHSDEIAMNRQRVWKTSPVRWSCTAQLAARHFLD
jgi:hypothetical protein